MRVLRETRQTLEVRLEEHEVAAHAEEAGRLHEELAAHAEREKHVRAELGAEKKRLLKELDVALTRVRTRREPRPVTVREELHPAERVVESIRVDTGEVVGKRPARRDELEEQKPLFDPPPEPIEAPPAEPDVDPPPHEPTPPRAKRERKRR